MYRARLKKGKEKTNSNHYLFSLIFSFLLLFLSLYFFSSILSPSSSPLLLSLFFHFLLFSLLSNFLFSSSPFSNSRSPMRPDQFDKSYASCTCVVSFYFSFFSTLQMSHVNMLLLLSYIHLLRQTSGLKYPCRLDMGQV